MKKTSDKEKNLISIQKNIKYKETPIIPGNKLPQTNTADFLSELCK